MKKNSLRSFERVKNLKTIEKVFSKNAFSVYGPFFSARFLLNSDASFPLQAGFSVSKRHYKKAVDRNKIKRWMRESYRTNKAILSEPIAAKKISLACFIILHKKLETQTYKEIESAITDLLSLIAKKIERNAPLDKNAFLAPD